MLILHASTEVTVFLDIFFLWNPITMLGPRVLNTLELKEILMHLVPLVCLSVGLVNLTGRFFSKTKGKSLWSVVLSIKLFLGHFKDLFSKH